MVRINPKVVWNKEAYFSFEKACAYIRDVSLDNADRVKKEILSITKKLPLNPEKHPLDKYKINNKGNYRAFEKYRFRITYRYTPKEIRIIRFRSTDQKPKNF